jgi:hypothetical protein
VTSFDWNDDKAIWEDLERAERMVGRRAEARKARKQKLSIPDDYDPERDCEIHDLRRQLDARIREAQTADNRCCEMRNKLLIMRWMCVGLFAALGASVLMLMFR